MLNKIALYYQYKLSASPYRESSKTEDPKPEWPKDDVKSFTGLSGTQRLQFLEPIERRTVEGYVFFWDPSKVKDQIQLFNPQGVLIDSFLVEPLVRNLQDFSYQLSKLPIYINKILTLGLYDQTDLYDILHRRLNASATITKLGRYLRDTVGLLLQ